MARPTSPKAGGDTVSEENTGDAQEGELGDRSEPLDGEIVGLEDNLPPAGSLEMTEVRWESPIPPPQIIEGYERVSPGLGKQIVEQAKAESEHVRAQDRKALAMGSAFLARGQWFGLVLGLAVIAVAGYAVYKGANSVAIAALSVIAAVAAVFVYRARSEKRSR